MCLSLIRVRFYPETIYFFSVQFILNELSSSYFLTSEIFEKISSQESVVTYHPENHKNIPTASEFDESFMGHWISRDESNGAVHFIIQDLENFLGFSDPLWQLLLLLLFSIFFLKITNFPKLYILPSLQEFHPEIPTHIHIKSHAYAIVILFPILDFQY